MASIASLQNCAPRPTTELSGWAIHVYSLFQQMEESNYGHKGKNEKTGLMLCMNRNKFYTIDLLYFGSIIYGIIKSQ